MDSDDYWGANNTLSTFYSIIKKEQFDILRSITWNVVSHKDPFTIKQLDYNSENLKQTTGEDYLYDQTFSYEIWLSCYKREFLLKYDLFFRENVVFEDSDWSTKTFYHANKIGIISFPFYHYRLSPNSITRKPRIQTFKDNISSISAIEDFLLSVSPLPENCKKACYARIKNSILSYILISRHYPIPVSVECFKGIRRNLLTETKNYNMSLSDHIKFKILLHFPYLLAFVIKFATLTKRCSSKYLNKTFHKTSCYASKNKKKKIT